MKKLGRPSKLTPALQRAICTSVRETKLSLADCARAAGLSPHQINDWMNRGRAEGSGRFFDFAVAIDRARAEGSKRLLARVAEAGKAPKHWQANMALLSVTEPQYSPRVRVVVEAELSAALERVTKEFAGEPAVLERVLRAIAGGELAEHEEASG